MIGNNIKQLRKERGMTQKELADQLFLTAQAVSRWENDEVEPSVSMIAKMAEIFKVPGDKILGIDSYTPKQESETENESPPQEHTSPVLAVCETCNRPIYKPEEIVRKANFHGANSVFCKSCENKRIQAETATKINTSIRRRKKSYIWGGISCALGIGIGIYAWTSSGEFINSLLWMILGILSFTFISCCMMTNNFIGDMTLTIFGWGFVKMPGLIFTLDLDGIIWLLTVKLALWILGLLLSVVFGVLAVVLGGSLSLFVYPFALHKSIVSPEKIDI